MKPFLLVGLAVLPMAAQKCEDTPTLPDPLPACGGNVAIRYTERMRCQLQDGQFVDVYIPNQFPPVSTCDELQGTIVWIDAWNNNEATCRTYIQPG